MNKDQFAYLNEEIQALTAERDALREMCEKMAEAMKKIRQETTEGLRNPTWAAQLAEESLAAYAQLKGKGDGAMGSEQLYSGQCQHKIPIGQHCMGCRR